MWLPGHLEMLQQVLLNWTPAKNYLKIVPVFLGWCVERVQILGEGEVPARGGTQTPTLTPVGVVVTRGNITAAPGYVCDMHLT